jgi:hypothetical protein
MSYFIQTLGQQLIVSGGAFASVLLHLLLLAGGCACGAA